MSYENLLTEVKDNILYITINRPDSLNAINMLTIQEVYLALKNHVDDKEVKGAIITGSGKKAFIAGADISEFSALSLEEGRALSEDGHMAFNYIEAYPKPVIAAVNGFALGGGCELAMACHMRIASENARFGQPEVNLGIIPGYGGTQRLADLIGKGRALELLMTADLIKADVALNYGLANAVVPQEELIPSCEKMLQKIFTKGPIAIAKVIKSVNTNYSGGGRIGDAYKVEVDGFVECMKSEDFAEGTKAFMEKRKADFKGV